MLQHVSYTRLLDLHLNQKLSVRFPVYNVNENQVNVSCVSSFINCLHWASHWADGVWILFLITKLSNILTQPIHEHCIGILAKTRYAVKTPLFQAYSCFRVVMEKLLHKTELRQNGQPTVVSDFGFVWWRQNVLRYLSYFYSRLRSSPILSTQQLQMYLVQLFTL